MERPTILHMLTPGRQMSPFDINMAADAGWQMCVPHCQVELGDIVALTQDAIFSRGPKGVARTGLFIGGRDAVLAMDMLDAARQAMVPPFQVSVFADPSGGYTTAAALVACVERELRKVHGQGLAGQRVLILGGTGPVGRIAGVMAAQVGAVVRLASHHGLARATEVAQATTARFGPSMGGADASTSEAVRAALAEADIVLATAAAGVQVLSAADLATAPQLRVVADVNAVPPAGIEGVGVMDDGKALPGGAMGLGALAVGNVKYQVQHRLLRRMVEGGQPVVFGPLETFALAREVVVEPA